MPAPPRPDPPAHVMRLAFEHDYLGQPVTNVLWVRNGNEDVPNPGELEAFNNDAISAWSDRILGVLMAGLELNDLDTIYYGPAGSTGLISPGAAEGGVSDSPNTPASVAAVISWQVQQRYRGGHPRTYLGGIPFDAIASITTFESEFVSSLTDRANDFNDAINAISHGALDDLHLGAVSFVHRGEWRDPPVFRDFTPGAAVVDDRIDTQRRRLGPDR